MSPGTIQICMLATSTYVVGTSCGRAIARESGSHGNWIMATMGDVIQTTGPWDHQEGAEE